MRTFQAVNHQVDNIHTHITYQITLNLRFSLIYTHNTVGNGISQTDKKNFTVELHQSKIIVALMPPAFNRTIQNPKDRKHESIHGEHTNHKAKISLKTTQRSAAAGSFDAANANLHR